MSIIRVQTFRYSFLNYLATILATCSTLWIYPLEIDAYGLAQLLASIAAFSIPLASMGTSSVVVKFFPEYKSLGLKSSFLFNVLLLAFGAFSVTLLVAFFINEPILKFLDDLGFDAYVVAKHKFVIVLLIGIMLYNGILMLHSSNYNKIVVPSVYQNLVPKLVLPLLILGLYYGFYDDATFTQFWVISFILASVGLSWYLWQTGALDVERKLTFFRQDRLKGLLKYSGYMGASAFCIMLLSKVDLIMVGTLLTLKDTGVYGIALSICSILVIPATGIWQIVSPMISEAFGQNNMERVSEVYKKSSVNLLIIGVPMYFLMLGTLDSILRLSPKYDDIAIAASLFAIIGMAKLIEMGAGVNQHILMFSPKYRRTLFFVAGMAIFNIVLSYLLISGIGILGAAMGTCITTYLYQIIKTSYIQKHFGITPLSVMTPRILLLFFILMAYYLVLPEFTSPILQAMMYAVGLTILSVLCIRLLRIESSVTQTIEARIQRMVKQIRGRF